MGVAIPRAIESHYQREAIQAREDGERWRAHPKNPMNMPVPKRQQKRTAPLVRITAADFDIVTREFEAVKP